MLAHPALPSFVPGCTRLALLNARLNAAHLMRPILAERHARSTTKQNYEYSLKLCKAARRRRAPAGARSAQAARAAGGANSHLKVVLGCSQS